MAQDNAKVTNLINSIKNVAPTPVKPQNKQTVDLINRIRGLQPTRTITSPQQGVPNLLTTPETDDAENFAQQIATGTFTGIGYLLRVITGLGRGITNAAYTTMTHANDAWDQFGKGNAQKGAEALRAIPADFVWGGFKGLASSVIPEFDKGIKPIDSRPIMEGGYDLVKSAEFKRSAKNLPFLKPLTEDKMLVDIPLPNVFDDKFRFQISNAGLGSTVWDIATDPASFATMGIGGALKGAGTAASLVRNYQKAGRPADLLAPAVTQQINTSPTRFILHSMGQGFKDAHNKAIARVHINREKRKAGLTFLGVLASKIAGKEFPAREDGGWLETFMDIADREAVIKNSIESLKKTGTVDPELEAELAAGMRSTIDDIISNIEKDPEGLRVVTGRDTLAALKRAADENGVDLPEELALTIANRYAMGIPRRKRVIEERKATDINLKQVEDVSRIGQDAANPLIETVSTDNFAQELDNILQGATDATRRRILKQLILPPGYRQKAFEKAQKGEEGGNLIKAAFGLKVSAKGRTRGVDKEFDVVQERVIGTKLTRSKLVEKTTAEEKWLMGEEKRLHDLYTGKPGSQSSAVTKGERTRIWTSKEAKDSAAKVAAHLKKIGVNSEDQITGQMILDSGVSPALLASRIKYILNQETVASRDLNLVIDVARQEFNPMTAQPESMKSSMFSFTAAERKGDTGKASTTLREVVELAVDATGQIRDQRLIELLGKIGIKARNLDDWMGVRNSKNVNLLEIVAELDRAYAQKLFQMELKVAQDILRKEFKANGQKFTMEDLTKAATRQLEEARNAEFNRLVATKVRSGLGITDEELLEAKGLVAITFEKQVAAREQLAKKGVDVASPAGELLFAAFTKTRSGRLASRTLSNEELAFGALKKAIENRPSQQAAVSRAAFFSDIETSLDRLLKAPNLPANTKAFAEKIGQMVKAIPEGSYTPQQLREPFARIGNLMRQLEDRMTPGESGFRLAFTQRGGEFATTRIPGAIVRLYRASIAKDSLDGGTFARHIDSLLAEKGMPTLAESADQYKAASKLKDVWGGDAVSTGLLMNIIRNTQHKGTRRLADETAVRNVAEWMKGVEEDATRMEKTLFDRMVETIIEDEKPIEQLIKANETKFITMKNTTGGNMEIPMGENATENAIVDGVMRQHRLVLNPRSIQSIKEYAQLPGADLRLFRITRNGKPVANLGEIQPGDILDHTNFSGTAHKYPAWLENTGEMLWKNKEKAPQLRMQQIAAEIYFRGLRQAYELAAKKLATHRASEIVKKIFPSYAKASEVISAVKGILKVNPNGAEQASLNMRARFWLADRLIRTDRAISQYDLTNTPTSRIKGFGTNPEGLKKQREQFETLLNKVDRQLESSGVVRGNDPVEGMTFDEVFATGNPRKMVDWIRQFKVTSPAANDEWQMAMAHLRNMTKIEKGSAYEDYEALLEAYKANREGFLPGEINPATGRPVPSTEQILGLLELRRGEEYIFGQKLGEKAYTALQDGSIPDRRTIMNWLRPIKPGSVSDELNQARRNDFIHAAQMVNGETVRKVADTLEPPEVVARQFQEALHSEIEALQRQGLDDVIVLAALAAGQSFRKFFAEGASYKFKGTDKLGRAYRADKPTGNNDRNVIKKSFEKETNLDGFKAIMQNLSSMAETKGYALGSPERMQWVGAMMQRTLRLRDLYYHARGIFPSTSVNLTSPEAQTLGIFTVKDLKKTAAGEGVMLSESDVLDLFSAEQIANLFAIGPINSMPITTLLPPARFLIQAFDKLPDSRYFNEEELRKVADTMMKVMIDNIKKTSVRKDKSVSAFEVDAEATYQRVALIVGQMIKPANAIRLFEQHTMNAAYATKSLKYHAGVLSSELHDAWLRTIQNPMASTGMKIEQTMKLMEELNGLLKIDMDDNIRLMLEMDSKVLVATNLDPDSVILAHEAEAMADTAEMAGIKAVQAANGARAQAAKLREPLHQAMLGNKLKASTEQGLPDGTNEFDVFNSHIVGEQEVNWALKFDYAVRGRAFANTGFEDLNGIYGPVERARAEHASAFEQMAMKMGSQWQKAAPGRNILEEAWNIIRAVPEEDLAKAANARSTLYNAADRKMAGEPGQLDVDTAKLLQDESDALDPYLTMDDELLNRAVIELWRLSAQVVGGGKFSLLRRAGLNPNYINRMIAEQGGGKIRGITDAEGNFIKTRDAFGFPKGSSDPTVIEQAWREWEISNPLDMLTSLHSALQQASKVPEMSVQVDRMFGVPKSQYKDLAAAKADGMVAIQSVKFPDRGKELVHFMQTEELYYPAEIALQLREFSNFVTEIKYMQGKGMLEKALVSIAPMQNFAKQQMTLFTLKNWIQNTVGGFFINGLAGINNPIATSVRSAKMLKTRGIDVDALGMDATKMDAELAKFHASQAKLGRVVRAGNDPNGDGMVVTVNGKPGQVSWADLGNAFEAYGGFPPVNQSRDLDLVTRPGAKATNSFTKTVKKAFQPYEKVSHKLGQAASYRDAFIRGQLFLDTLAKGNWKSFDEAVRESMKKVDRYHPQMQDLSAFNQRYTRNLVLFFTWRAKTLGVILMDLLDKPGRSLATLKAQYNLTQNEQTEGNEYRRFGDFTPAGYPTPDWLQGNMDPLITGESGQTYKFSVANPVTDLLGSTSWLSGIDFNTYEPITDQVFQMGAESIDKFIYSSQPLLLQYFLEWGRGTTMDGSKLGSGGGFSFANDGPAVVEDAFKRVGLNMQFMMLAQAFPDMFRKASWEGQLQTTVDSEAKNAWANWLLGIKLGQIDTPENRQKGYQELLQKLEKLRKP